MICVIVSHKQRKMNCFTDLHHQSIWLVKNTTQQNLLFCLTRVVYIIDWNKSSSSALGNHSNLIITESSESPFVCHCWRFQTKSCEL